jgi:hypothetical protein
MDSGDVIPCLNEDWAFAGCKMFEWLAGLMTSFLASSAFEKPATAMPILVIVWVATTLGMAYLRKQFPDEERGVRNMCMVSCGFAPPGIPAPAKLQPRWSGGRISEVGKMSMYSQLGLEELRNMKVTESAGLRRF